VSVLAGVLLDVVAEAKNGPTQAEQDAITGARSLRDFIRIAWPIIEPGVEYVDGWHITAIAEHLEAVSAGEVRNLLINVPPRHMKSLATSVLWPAWEWIQRPSTKFIGASYGADLATRDTVRARRLMASPWFQQRWGGRWRFVTDQNTKTRYDNDHGGHRIATSVGGSVTGEGADIFLIDDPHKLEHAHQEIPRAAAVSWVREVVPSRLNDKKTGRIVCIMQRVHQADVSASLIDLGYTHLCLPCEYEPKHPFVWPDDPRTEPGELLWPAKEGPVEVATIKASLGAQQAAGQLQQRPAPAEGGLFKLARIQRYDTILDPSGRILAFELHHEQKATERVERGVCRIVQRMDLAVSEKTSADYTVLGTAAITPNRDVILLDVDRRQLAGPDQPGMVKAGYARWLPSQIGVESNQYQLSLVQALQREGLPVVERRSDRDKVSRALVAAIAMENRRVFLPMQASWLAVFEEEIRDFPNSAHDDQVDVLAGVTEDASAKLSSGWEDLMRAQIEGA
jgi:predicted phage terminase large subunit-like protein